MPYLDFHSLCRASFLRLSDAYVTLKSLVANLVPQVALSLLVRFHILLALGQIVLILALQIGRLLFQFRDLLLHVHLLYLLGFHFLLRGRHLMLHQLVLLGPHLHERLHLGTLYIVIALELLIIFRLRKLPDQTLGGLLEVGCDAFHLIVQALLSTINLIHEVRVTVLKEAMPPQHLAID